MVLVVIQRGASGGAVYSPLDRGESRSFRILIAKGWGVSGVKLIGVRYWRTITPLARQLTDTPLKGRGIVCGQGVENTFS